jgi:uncharacterized protein
LLTILAMAVAAAVAWVAFTTLWLWRHQERVVFQPPAESPDAPAPAKRVAFPASDGHPLFGFLLEPLAGHASGGTVVIAFHGNADLAAWTVPWAKELMERARVSVFVPEFRGYGGIAGSPTYTTASSDAAGALEYVRRTLRPTRIVLFGHSLGSAIASDLAASMREQPPASLVLQSPFSSARAMASRMLVPPIPGLWRTISRVHYDTRSIVARMDVPVWVAHGSRDLTVPARMGQEVHAASRRPGDLLLVPGAGHNDVADVGGEGYWRWLVSAVSTGN